MARLARLTGTALPTCLSCPSGATFRFSPNSFSHGYHASQAETYPGKMSPSSDRGEYQAFVQPLIEQDKVQHDAQRPAMREELEQVLDAWREKVRIN